MGLLRLVALALVIVIAGGCIGIERDVERGSGSSSGAAPARDDCAAAQLVTAQFGIAACGRGVFTTSDWGRWRRVSRTSDGAYPGDVLGLDPKHAWFVTEDCAGVGGTVHRSVGGGAQWSTGVVGGATCAAGSAHELGFLDESYGWAATRFGSAGAGPLSLTHDGGATWRRVGLLPLNGSVVFDAREHGWFARAMNGSRTIGLYETVDGGGTWRRRRLDLPDRWKGAQAFPDRPAFFGPEGVLPVDLQQGGRAAVAFYVTHDRGATWKVAHVQRVLHSMGQPPDYDYVPASVVSPTTWWLVFTSMASVTTDGGRHWSSLPTTQTARGELTAVDARHAWLLDRGTLYATADAGRSWRALDPR
jgi:photosystem II stability/assembly factor-like uncharacterized protein